MSTVRVALLSEGASSMSATDCPHDSCMGRLVGYQIHKFGPQLSVERAYRAPMMNILPFLLHIPCKNTQPSSNCTSNAITLAMSSSLSSNTTQAKF
eukprot:1171411-Amphidinium_carterae.1